jgi:hypothetical protein
MNVILDSRASISLGYLGPLRMSCGVQDGQHCTLLDEGPNEAWNLHVAVFVASKPPAGAGNEFLYRAKFNVIPNSDSTSKAKAN